MRIAKAAFAANIFEEFLATIVAAGSDRESIFPSERRYVDTANYSTAGAYSCARAHMLLTQGV